LRLTVEIETHDNMLVFHMFETYQSTMGMEKGLAKDLRVKLERDYYTVTGATPPSLLPISVEMTAALVAILFGLIALFLERVRVRAAT